MNACIMAQNAPNSEGYSPRTVGGVRKYEHVWAWEAAHGPVPDGMVIDHVCHDPTTCTGGRTCPHRRCCNVEHLTLATRADNARRGTRPNAKITHCPDGHEYTDLNTYVDPQGRRHCRACRPKHRAAHRARRAA